jgi:glycosyltransferase involved in cell wall biosynthesis
MRENSDATTASIISLSEYRRAKSLRPFVSIIIPAFNEEKSIAHVLQAIPRNYADEIIVVNNGSTDATAQLADACGARVIDEPQRGYGAACLAGIAALSRESEVVVFLDADFSDFPEEMEKLLTPILHHKADLVISTRTRDSEARAALTPQQRWGNALATWLIRWRFGYSYSDLGPFRAIRRDALGRIEMQDRNFGWTVEMQIKALQHNLRVTEVPVSYRIRIGRSKISGTLKGTILAGTKIIYTIAKYAFLHNQSSESCKPGNRSAA